MVVLNVRHLPLDELVQKVEHQEARVDRAAIGPNLGFGKVVDERDTRLYWRRET